MTDVEAFVVETARGVYRDEINWPSPDDKHSKDFTFDGAEEVLIDPFATGHRADASVLRGIYATFLEYETDDIARVYIRPESGDTPTSTWFDEPAGEYFIHERYLIPRY
jgi:hypothetical protein